MKTNFKFLLALTLIAGTIGCSGIKNSMRLSEKNSQWNPLHKLVDKKDEKKPKQGEDPAIPVTMQPIWAYAELEVGAETQRGFGGKFYFYDESHQPIQVDGELVVYGFDNSNDRDPSEGADRTFVFRQADLQKHMTKTSLVGPAYNFWCNWEPRRSGPNQTRSITLIPMFRTADGKLLKCGQSINILKGDNEIQVDEGLSFKSLGSSPAVIRAGGVDKQKLRKSSISGGVKQVSFEGQAAAPARLRTTTFNMTPNLANRVAAEALTRPQSQGSLDSKAASQLPQSEALNSDAAASTGELPSTAATSSSAANQSSAQYSNSPQATAAEASQVTQSSSQNPTKQPVFGQPGPFYR